MMPADVAHKNLNNIRIVIISPQDQSVSQLEIHKIVWLRCVFSKSMQR